MLREEARREINGRPLTDFIDLQRSRKAGRDMYICPVCGSGTGKNGTGAFHIYKDSNRVFCYSGNCFSHLGEDTLGALRIIWQCGETEAIERAGYKLDREAPAPAHQNHQENNVHQNHQEHIEHTEGGEHQNHQEPQPDYTSFYRQCHVDLKQCPEALDYLHGRGITDESIERFNLGYCAAWKHPKSPNSRPTKRVIIPRTAESYTARMIEAPLNEWEEDRKKQTTKQKALFNLEALDGADTPIICEGELDAISLYQAGASSVVAIGTTTNTSLILEEAMKHPEAVYILALDNDEEKENGKRPGYEAQMRLALDMKAKGLEVVNIKPGLIYGKAKDGNEAFVKDRERLESVIRDIQEKAQTMKAERDEEREEDLKKRTGEGMLENFLLSVTDKEARTFEPIPTGIKGIDRALEGGFVRKTLVTLGAPPAMGKTALAQWIFENMAMSGHDVLYLNLEMSREQLLARSISRIAWKTAKKDFSALDVLRGYAWTDEQRETIMAAAGKYKNDIAPHFVYNPDGVTNKIASILQAMQEETARIKALGRPAPLVCIDYLQLVDSGERDAIEGTKNVIFKLKEHAKRENTVVFVVIANNRESNKKGTVDMESGRDTSAIEYSGDVMLGLVYTAIEDKRKHTITFMKNGEEQTKRIAYDLDEIRRLKKEAYEEGKEIPTVCKAVSLKVVKSRFTEAERRANLVFDGKHSTFNEVEYRHRLFNVEEDEWENPFEKD